MEMPEGMSLDSTPVQADCRSAEVRRGRRRKKQVSPLLHDTPRGALTRYHLRPSEVLKRRITLEPTRLSGSKRGTPTKNNRKSVATPKRKKSVRFAIEEDGDSCENASPVVKMEPAAETVPRSPEALAVEIDDPPAVSHVASPAELPDILPSVVCDAMKLVSDESTEDILKDSETKKQTEERNVPAPPEGFKLQRKNFVPAVKSKIPVHHKSKQSLALPMKCKKSTSGQASVSSQNTPKVAGYLRPTASSAAKSRPNVLGSLFSNTSGTPASTAMKNSTWRLKTPAQKSTQLISKTKTC